MTILDRIKKPLIYVSGPINSSGLKELNLSLALQLGERLVNSNRQCSNSSKENRWKKWTAKEIKILEQSNITDYEKCN